MQKTCLMEITMIILVEFTLANLQDHIILWDASNWRFKENRNDIYANEGDNLIFICPKNRTFSQNLYWTVDSRVQLKCNKTLPIKVIKLLDCFGNKSVQEFVLKVSRFPEIVSLPSFHPQIPVYFVAQSVICQQNNFRLSVKLVSGNMTNISYQNVTNEETQTTKHSRKSDVTSSSSISSQLKTIEIQNHLNDTTDIFWNQEYNTKQLNWIEYRFLLLPATLAFFTLISIQIVLCGFWFSNSITKKLINCFKKPNLKHRNLELHVNRMYKNRQMKRYLDRTNSFLSTDETYKLSVPRCEVESNDRYCWKSKTPLSIKKPDLNNTLKQQNCTNPNWYICFNQSDNYTSPCKFIDYQCTPNLLITKKNSLVNQNIPDTSTILCNCINQSTNLKFMQNQELLIPVTIYLDKSISED
ncbi:unnamed protein product [Schistosoma turkestanicum]|nr:unnamed protein product [Schistosoma turkestanicum]